MKGGGSVDSPLHKTCRPVCIVLRGMCLSCCGLKMGMNFVGQRSVSSFWAQNVFFKYVSY